VFFARSAKSEPHDDRVDSVHSNLRSFHLRNYLMNFD
jgi:hypothetical protein